MTEQKITKTHVKTQITIDGVDKNFECDHYSCEPEFVGRMPLRTELEVIKADSEESLNLGWSYTEYNGCEVCLPYTKTIINSKNGLRDGMSVCIWDSMLVIVHKAKSGDWYWETENSFGDLEFSKDSRKCWTSPNIINKKVANINSYYDYNMFYGNINEFFVNILYDIERMYYKVRKIINL